MFSISRVVSRLLCNKLLTVRAGGVAGWWCGVGLVVVGAGVGEQGGDGDPDAGLVVVFAVQAFDVERGEELFYEVVGGLVEDAGQVGQFVDQAGVVVLAGGGFGVGELDLGAGALVVELGVAGPDALAVGGGGRRGVGAEFF
jgi:hypothetical protein